MSAAPTSEAEKFWTEGHDAIQSATGADLQPGTSTTTIEVDGLRFGAGLHGLCRHCGEPCRRNADGFWVHEKGVLCDGRLCAAEPIGIDVPGVGLVSPASGSPVELRSGRESAVDEVPQWSRDLAGGVEVNEAPGDRRERLISQLIFAARELALAQIEPADGAEPPFCTECTKDAHDTGAIVHEDDCLTGRVVRLIADLVETLRSKPSQREAVSDGETPQAADAIRPLFVPDPTELSCESCGYTVGIEGWMLVAQTSHQLGSAMRTNQVEMRQGGWWYRYEHNCTDIARKLSNFMGIAGDQSRTGGAR